MKSKPKNITQFQGSVGRISREKLHGHRGFLVWFTGYSASGKSTIAHLVEQRLSQRGISTYVLDGDNVRHGLCSDLGFSPEDRTENIRRIGEVGNLLVDAGIVVLTALISPYQADRQKARGIFQPGDFIEVYTSCPIETCAVRDWKGLYAKAKSGEIKEFTGISSRYEEPENPEIKLHTDKETAIEASTRIIRYLETNGFISVQNTKGENPTAQAAT